MPIHNGQLTQREIEELRKNLLEEVLQKPIKKQKPKRTGRDLGQPIARKNKKDNYKPIIQTNVSASKINDEGDRQNSKSYGTMNVSGKFYRN